MELTLQELNDLYYCLGRVKRVSMKMIDNDTLDKLMDKIRGEIEKKEDEIPPHPTPTT